MVPTMMPTRLPVDKLELAGNALAEIDDGAAVGVAETSNGPAGAVVGTLSTDVGAEVTSVLEVGSNDEVVEGSDDDSDDGSDVTIGANDGSNDD